MLSAEIQSAEDIPGAEFASTHRQPSVFSHRLFVDAGGLVSYGANRPEMYGRTAAYVDHILKGASPLELPVEMTSVWSLWSVSTLPGRSASPSRRMWRRR